MSIITAGNFEYVQRQEGGYCLTDWWALYTEIDGWEFRVFDNISKQLILEHKNSWLKMFAGYMWNGASGVKDRKANRRASCGHDAWYRALRESIWPQEFRQRGDEVYVELYIEDGGWKWVGWGIDYPGLRLLGANSAKPQPEVDTIKRVS